jgi:CheY-specific phosphatase CheX
MVMAGEITANDTLILLGMVGSVKGDARVMISAQAALALGVALGLTLALLGRLLRFRKRD